MKKIIIAVALVALMAGTAYASAEWNFYGAAKIYTVWHETDVIDGDDGDTQFSEGLYDCSNIGADVKVSDELTGKFEYGAENGVANIRYLYGTWNFGSGSLTVGKDNSPIHITYSNQLVAGEEQDLGLGGFGDFDQSRVAQVRLTFGGFSIAIIDPYDDAAVINNTGTEFVLSSDDDALVSYDTQAVIPMIAVSYIANFDMGEFYIAGGYNTFELDDENIDAYGIGLGASLNFGAFGVFGTFVWGENIANLGTETATDYAGYAAYVGGEVYDCESMGGTIGVTFAINEMFGLEAGYGYIIDDYDEDGVDTDIAQSYYLQAVITLAPGVTITPEVGMIDNREDGQDETLYFGAGWEIAF